MKHDIHVYPIFRVKIKDLQGTPEEMVAAAEFAVGVALNENPHSVVQLNVVGQESCGLFYADGFDSALVDNLDDKGRRLDSTTVSPMRDEALEHIKALDAMIAAWSSNDAIVDTLTPIKAFLENIR